MSLAYRDIVFLLPVIYVVCGVDGLQNDKNTAEDWCNSLEGWNNVVHGNFCYTVHQRSLAWSAAVSDCENKGGQLFKGDAGDLAYVLFKQGGPSKVWTGAKERDGTEFQWIDGTSFVFSLKYRMDGWISEFKALASTEPICLTVDLVAHERLTFSGTWDKERCSKVFPYVCEHDLNGAFERVWKATNTPPHTRETTKPLLAEGATSTASGIRTSPGAHTGGTTLMLAKPVSQPKQHRYKGIKHINRRFNPKLKAKPDLILTGTMTDCARFCSQNNCCEMFNHFPHETCALYCDKKRATAKGATSVLGSKVWVIDTY